MPKKSPSTEPPVDDAQIRAIIESLPPITDDACQRIVALLCCGGDE